MPLYDHFRPPVRHDLPWDSLLSGWATHLTTVLNLRWLPNDFVALEQTHGGWHAELEVTELPEVYAPPQTLTTIPGVLPDVFEVRVFATRYGRQLVGAIELISPGNKDRGEERQAFVAKCANYLAQGVSVVVLDIVTTRQANLHNELLHGLNAPAGRLPDNVALYAAAYRSVLRGNEPQIDVWAEPCTVGAALPTIPLRLTGDLFVPVEFELTYLETCRQRRLIG